MIRSNYAEDVQCCPAPFSLDGVSFVNKHNPRSTATAAKSTICWQWGEEKQRIGGWTRIVHALVVIAYGRRVTICIPVFCEVNERSF